MNLGRLVSFYRIHTKTLNVILVLINDRAFLWDHRDAFIENTTALVRNNTTSPNAVFEANREPSVLGGSTGLG